MTTRQKTYPHLLSPGTIGPITLANRVVMPAMDMNLCVDGEIEQGDIGFELGGDLQCFRSVCRDPDVVPGQLQPELQAFSGIEIVVGDEDSFAHGRLR